MSREASVFKDLPPSVRETDRHHPDCVNMHINMQLVFPHLNLSLLYLIFYLIVWFEK